MFRNLVFWQPTISFHQSAFIAAVQRETGWSVWLAAPCEQEELRVGMKWRTAVPSNVSLAISPSSQQIKALLNGSYTLHVHSGLKELGFCNAVLPDLSSRPMIVCSEAATYSSFAAKRFKQLVYRFRSPSLANASGVLAMGSLGVDWFKSIGVRATNAFPYAYFVDLPAPREPSPPRSSYRFLAVARMHWQKAPDLLLKAFSLLPDRRCELTLVGDGPWSTKIDRMIDDRCLTGRVERRGFLPREDILRLMGGADCLVCSSRCDGWAVVVPEALSQGCRVIVSPNVGASDLVRSPEIGEVLGSLTIQDIAEAMRRAVELGPATDSVMQKRQALAQQTTPQIGAKYFISILKHIFDGEVRPRAPWEQQLLAA